MSANEEKQVDAPVQEKVQEAKKPSVKTNGSATAKTRTKRDQKPVVNESTNINPLAHTNGKTVAIKRGSAEIKVKVN